MDKEISDKTTSNDYIKIAKDDNIEIEMDPFDKVKPTARQKTSSSSIPDLTKRVLRGPLAPANNLLNAIEGNIKDFIKKHNRVVTCLMYVVFTLGYIAYVISACFVNFKRARVLIYLTAVVVFCIIYWFVKKYFGDVIWRNILEPIQKRVLRRYWKLIKWSCICSFIIFVSAWVIYDTMKNAVRLISLAGLFIYILIGFLFSTNRSRIKWRPVLWGFALQFVFALIILRTDIGYEVFKWIGDIITKFLSFSSEGGQFLFGNLSQFAFTVFPVIVYFAAFTYVIYYVGIIHVVIRKIAWLLQITMGTSPAESFNAAGNIFIGQTEAPLLIRPFLEGMTASELHAVMTGGFATIAGSVLAIYIHLGVSAHHLVSASIMSAPAALAMSKLMCPEVEEPKIKTVDDIEVEEMDEQNIFEAIAVGAAMSISLIANIAVMLIAFLSMLKCANAILGWLGIFVGVPDFSFEYICSYAFMPFAYIMGISWDDSFKVAELLGVKTFLNEFVAYQRFSVLINNKVKGTGDMLSMRSEIITTYALCGFANFSSLGVQLGGISSLAPSKRGVLAKHVFRAMCAGTLACFMTACIAGVLYEDENYDISHNLVIDRVTNATTSTLNTTVMTMLSSMVKTKYSSSV